MSAATAARRSINPIEPIHRAEIARVSRFVADEPFAENAPKLVGPNGDTVELPEEIYRVLAIVADEMRAGNAVSVVPHAQRVSTQEAAELLGISRPTLIKLLEAGEIPYEQPGRHRRVKLSDVLEYRERTHRGAREALDQLTAEASAAGLYENGAEDYTAALREAKHRRRAR